MDKRWLLLGLLGLAGYYWYSTQGRAFASPVKAIQAPPHLAVILKSYQDQGWDVRANGDVRNPATGEILNIEGKVVTTAF